MNLLSLGLLTGVLSAHAGDIGVIGVRYAEHPEGLVIRRVLDESGAQAAGLMTGDRIVSVDGVELNSGEDMPPLRGEMGSTVTLGLYRPLGSELVTVTVTETAKKPAASDDGLHPAVARFAGAMRMNGGPKIKRAVSRLVKSSYGEQDAADAIGQKLVRAAKRRKAAARAALKAFSGVSDPPPGLMYRMGEAPRSESMTLRSAGSRARWKGTRTTQRVRWVRVVVPRPTSGRRERQAAIELTRQLARYRRVLPLTKKVGMANPTPEEQWEIDLPPLADFSVETMSGDTWTLSEQKGKPVVLVFWATWCGPCKKEMPALAELLNNRPDWPVSFLAVSVDDDRAAAKAERMVKDWALPFPSVRTADLMERFGVSSLPSMRVIGPNGSLRSSSRGYSESSVKKLKPHLMIWSRRQPMQNRRRRFRLGVRGPPARSMSARSRPWTE